MSFSNQSMNDESLLMQWVYKIQKPYSLEELAKATADLKEEIEHRILKEIFPVVYKSLAAEKQKTSEEKNKNQSQAEHIEASANKNPLDLPLKDYLKLIAEKFKFLISILPDLRNLKNTPDFLKELENNIHTLSMAVRKCALFIKDIDKLIAYSEVCDQNFNLFVSIDDDLHEDKPATTIEMVYQTCLQNINDLESIYEKRTQKIREQQNLKGEKHEKANLIKELENYHLLQNSTFGPHRKKIKTITKLLEKRIEQIDKTLKTNIDSKQIVNKPRK